MIPLRRVAIILCIFRAEDFLAEQLESIRGQIHRDWTLIISDDGCSDATYELIRAFEGRLASQKIIVRGGPRRGAAQNFLSTLIAADPDFDAYAYCDQDDIWHPDRLARGLECLARVPSDRPALWCSRTRLIDAAGKAQGLSPLFRKPPSFANALVQNIGGGNTMLFNRAARDVLVAAGEVDVVAHDWWTYKLVAGVGGCVVYDHVPSIDYRQHDANLIGANVGGEAALRRMLLLTSGRFAALNAQDLSALRRSAHLLTPANRALLSVFEQLKAQRVADRLNALRTGGFYRQTTRGQCGLIAGAVMRWL